MLYGSIDGERVENRDPNFNNYLLQEAGRRSTIKMRSNPLESHSGSYALGAEWFRAFGPKWDMRARVDYFWGYEYNNNPWFSETDTTGSAEILPSARAEAMLRLDPRNSYVMGQHSSALRAWIPVSYEKSNYRDGQVDSKFGLTLDMKAWIRRNSIDFNGQTDARKVKNSMLPDVALKGYWAFNRQTNQLWLNYRYYGTAVDVFNLLDNVVFDSDPLNLRTGNPNLKPTMAQEVSFTFYNSNYAWNRLKYDVRLNYYTFHNQQAMSYSYNRATGVRTFKPVNVNGNRYAEIFVRPDLALTRDKKLRFVNVFQMMPRRSVDMVSYDGFSSTQESVVKSMYISEASSIIYNVKKFMAALDGKIETRKTTSGDGFFDPFRITTFSYGVRGRVTLPAGWEINTDLKMYSNRGFDYGAMNTNQLVWNARLTKSFLNGKIMVFVDGYDILSNVKNITYKVNEQGRTETWVNNIPSYVMFSLRWNFNKKPKN